MLDKSLYPNTIAYVQNVMRSGKDVVANIDLDMQSPDSLLPHTKRLSIPYTLYNQSPTKAIKQLLGHNITLVNYTTNDVITSDDTVLVDVSYHTIPVSILQIYYVPVSSFKRLHPNSDKYVTTINGCNVKITSLPNMILDNKQHTNKTHRSVSDSMLTQTLSKYLIPIRIRPTLNVRHDIGQNSNINTHDSNSMIYTTLNDSNYTYAANKFISGSGIPRSESSISLKSSVSNVSTVANSIRSLHDNIPYYATLVHQPLSCICTPLKYLTNHTEPFITEPITTFYTEEFRKAFDADIQSHLHQHISRMVEHYKQSLNDYVILSSIDQILVVGDENNDGGKNKTVVKCFADCKRGTTGYIITYDMLPTDEDVKGIILAQPKRLPQYILYYPTDNYIINRDELESVINFLRYDETNFYNYYYVKFVVNV